MIKPSFLNHVEVSQQDIAKLLPFLTHWLTLNKALSNDELSVLDIEKLVIMEINDKKRAMIVDRLVMRRFKFIRKEQMDELLALITGDK